MAQQLDQLSMRDLRILCLTAELGTISAAARALDISQPTASYSIEKARQILSDNLFTSSNRTLSPTDLCQRVIAVAETTLRGFRQAILPKDLDPKNISGEVTILRRTNDWRWGEKLCQRFFETAPLARLTFLTTNEVNVDKYLAQHCDFFIGTSAQPTPNVLSHTFNNIPCGMVFDPANVTPPKTIEEFPDHRFAVSWAKIGLPNRGIGVIDQALLDKGVRPRMLHFKSPSLTHIEQILRVTDMIYTGSYHALPDNFAGLCHAPIPFEVATMSISVHWLEAKRQNPLVAHAMDLAIEAMEEEYSLEHPRLVTTPYQPGMAID